MIIVGGIVRISLAVSPSCPGKSWSSSLKQYVLFDEPYGSLIIRLGKASLGFFRNGISPQPWLLSRRVTSCHFENLKELWLVS